MKRGYLLPLLAALGVLAAVVVSFRHNRAPAVQEPFVKPASAPYRSYVAGSGVVEASSGNIAIASPVSGIVTAIFVQVGAVVEAGAPLYKIDDRDLQAQRAVAQAKVEEAAAALQKAGHSLDYSEELHKRDPAAISAERLTGLRDDAALAEATLALARAQARQIDVELERHTVRAPMAGTVLQLSLHLGESAQASGGLPPGLVLGSESPLHVRVDIDQQDAWRVRQGAAAVAFGRGNPALRFPLTFAYMEPLVVPKTALTGQSTERTDTRVLQVLYRFEQDDQSVYVGQQLDVYIEAPPAAAGKP